MPVTRLPDMHRENTSKKYTETPMLWVENFDKFFMIKWPPESPIYTSETKCIFRFWSKKEDWEQTSNH